MRIWLFLQVGIMFLAGEILTAAEPMADCLTFGAVADIQYADKTAKGSRSYRKTLDRAGEFVTAMNQDKPLFVVSLGDHTDGRSVPADRKADVDAVSALLKKLVSPLKVVVGNHDTYAGIELLTEALGCKDLFYTFTVQGHEGWRFIVLNGNDGKGAYVMSEKQIAWFGAELSKAKAAGERVICFCHQPLLNEASPRTHTLANPGPVLKVMDECGDGVVQAWICGHDHTGGYAYRKGVHHLTMPGMVETHDSTSYALITLTPDRIVVRGVGRAPSCELPYGKAPAVEPVMNDVKKKTPAKEVPAVLPEAA